MNKKNQQGVIMPKENKLISDEDLLPFEEVNDEIPFKEPVTYTLEMLKFLYSPTFSRRYPLTRCLFMSVVEYVSRYKSENEQNFTTVVEILNQLLCDLSDDRKTKSERLKILLDKYHSYISTDDNELFLNYPDWAIDAFHAFYYYNKIEAQQYTIACLLYDLIPLVHMSFEEMHNAIKNNRKLNEIIDFQKQQAIYRGYKDFDQMMKIRVISDKLFHQTDIAKKSLFILATFLTEFTLTEHNLQCANMNFEIKRIRELLKQILKNNNIESDDFFEAKNELTTTMLYYKNIAESAELNNVVSNVLERILFLNTNVNNMYSMMDNSSKDYEFFF